jgi:RNA polymerase sigma-70 factor (ECF subfamily)
METLLCSSASGLEIPVLAILQADKDRQEERDEAQMIAAIIGGETELYHDLIQPYEALVYRTGFKMLGSQADAEDVAQETFLRAYRKLASFRFGARFSTWLVSIALNEARGRLRKQKVRSTTSIDSFHEHAAWSPALLIRDKRVGPLEAVEHDELRSLLLQAISELPAHYEQVLRMHVFDEQSVKLTAQAIRASEEVVKTRLYRARRLLRKKLEFYRQRRAGSTRLDEYLALHC